MHIALGIIEKGDKQLLLRRNNAPFKDLWSLPGGTVEEHENAKEAVQREVHEETQLPVTEARHVGHCDETLHEEESHIHEIDVFTVETAHYDHTASSEGELAFLEHARIRDEMIPSDAVFLDRYLKQEYFALQMVVEHRDASYHVVELRTVQPAFR